MTLGPLIDLIPVDLRSFNLRRVQGTKEFARVGELANSLLAHLNTAEALRSIADANLPGASSHAIQDVFRDYALTLGFLDESRGLFAEYETSALRPDYFMSLPEHETGIILEVERGKTTINNMDLLDFWKCHLCAHAHYLFLIVPRALRQNETMRPRNEFATVAKRLATFFMARNETNVRGLFLYGY
jgi:hypothetical protein